VHDVSVCGNINQSLATAMLPIKPLILLLRSACCTTLAVTWWQGSLGVALLVGAVQ